MALPSKRYDLVKNQIACWPSTGGVWLLDANIAYLDHLHLNKLENFEKDHNAQAEDKFCEDIHQLGAMHFEIYGPSTIPDPECSWMSCVLPQWNDRCIWPF
jgi:hypothetical protein